jgi:transposase-like protein
MRENKTKSEILEAFELSETKTIADVCRIVGIVPSTYYFHQYRDADFRRQVLEKRLYYLTAKTATDTASGEMK